MRERARIVASIHDDDGSDLDEGAHHTGTQLGESEEIPIAQGFVPRKCSPPLKGLEGANIINQGLI